MKSLIFIPLFLLLVVPLWAQHAAYSEEQKTDHLIQFVRNLKGATFIRNGSEHTPADAADHLQYKREKAGSRVKTARDFIDKIASQSSITGTPYLIRFPNGKEFPVKMVLTSELNKLEEGKVSLLTRTH